MSKNDPLRMTKATMRLLTPVELLHGALALCLTALVSHAQAQAQAQAPTAEALPAESPASSASAASAAASAPLPTPLPAPLPAAPKQSALAAAPDWDSLSPAQRTNLAPLERDWRALDAEHRSKWLSVANLLPALPVEEQVRMQERMRDWARLSPLERRQARIGFQAAIQVGADQRQAKWAAYQALPAERKAELAHKAVKKQAAAAAHPGHKPVLGAQSKSNLLPASAKPVPVTAVAASLIQARPGASTVLITRLAVPPLHQSAGRTKVVADPDLVDPKTLLPKTLHAPAAIGGAAAS